MRKTQSADPIEENSKQAPPPTKDDGHLSDSAVAPTRERKKGELFFPGNFAAVRSFFTKAPAPHLVRARLRERRTRGNSRCRMSANPYVFIPSFSAGVPWTEDEHRLFLLGLQKLGKVSSGGYIYFRTESFRRHPAFFIRAARARRGVVERRATEHCGHRAYFGPFPRRGVPSGRSRRWKTSSDASVPSFFARGTGGTPRALRSMLHRQRSA